MHFLSSSSSLSLSFSKELQMEAEQIHAPKANGYATILAIGGVNPPHIVEQSDYPDYYFRVTNSEHLTDLKDKCRRICDRTAIRKRHFMWDEEFIKANPSLQTFNDPSLNLRQQVVMEEIPKQGMAAALKAIEKWGQPKSRITHLIFCTTSGIDLPGADLRLTKILGLNPSVYRVMLYQQGCFAGAAVIRIAKDLAESRQGSRVLVVCSESTTVSIRAPSHENPDDLIIQSLFGDGASAFIVGADPDVQAKERPIFSIISASQMMLPDTEWALSAHLGEGGVLSVIHRDVPLLVSKKVPGCLEEAFGPLGISDWNSIFWVVHPGGRAILDQVENIAGLKPEKLQASRKVLAEYGNMAGVTVHFILDEMSRKSAEEGKGTTGEGLKWGVLFGFGPGLTVETIVLRSAPLP